MEKNLNSPAEESPEIVIAMATMLNHSPGLVQSLGTEPYRSVLELGCGDIETYKTLMNSVIQPHGIYIGFNLDKNILDKMRLYYERNQGPLHLRRSRFFERDITFLEERGNFFDLICVNSLQHHFLIKNEDILEAFIFKLLRHARKVILQVIPSEELTGLSLAVSPLKDELLSCTPIQDRIPSLRFFPITLYETIARSMGKKVSVFEGEPFGYERVGFKTKYVVFE